MNRIVRKRAGAVLAGAALLVGGLTACDGAKKDGAAKDAADAGAAAGAAAGASPAPSPVEAVKASWLKTAAAKFAMAEVRSTGSDGKVSTQTGTKGWYPSSHDLTVKGPTSEARSVMTGDVIYTQRKEPVNGKAWMKLDLSVDGKPGVRMNEDPAEYLALLLGQPKVALVPFSPSDAPGTRHYRAALTGADLQAADEATKVMPEKDRQYLHESVKHLTVLEADVWIGKDDYPVHALTVSHDDKGVSSTQATFDGFGQVAPVAAPPADQVADFDEVLKGG
ncbi:hypothetical protein ABT143_12085 [Streptomyces sp. NPDC002033]|uniref:hypothetical protein n=1 Tax=unclassified Streptomyces TaxID=2593676 RepID=UPI003332297D